MFSCHALGNKVNEIVKSIFDVYDINKCTGVNVKCTIGTDDVVCFNGTYKIFAMLDARTNFLSPLDGFLTVTFDVIGNEIWNIGCESTMLMTCAMASIEGFIKEKVNEWLKEASKPKIWIYTANPYIDPAIKEKYERFMKSEREAIWETCIPDEIKRYIENDPVIMSKNYISEEEKEMITPKTIEAEYKINNVVVSCIKKFYAYRTADFVLKTIGTEKTDDRHSVRLKFEVYDTQKENQQFGSMTQSIRVILCSYCDDIQILDVELESINCLKLYTSETSHDLREFIFKNLKAQFNNKKENEDMDKKCINRANVYKTMTVDQKIVMQDAIANAVESAIKDCRMEYEKTIKALRHKMFYGSNSMLSKFNKLKDSLEVKKIIINEPAMIVFWEDGTKTVVTAKDEAFDPEKGLAMAFAKKALGNNYAAGGKFKAKLKHAQIIKGKEESNKKKEAWDQNHK